MTHTSLARILTKAIFLTLWVPRLVLADVPPSGLVVPGKSMGAVHLGMTFAEVRNAIGSPAGHFTMGGGVLESIWHSPLPDGYFALFQVFYRRGRVAQITTNLPGYRTADGINAETTRTAFEAHYPRATRRYFDGKQAETGYYVDWNVGGIAVRASGSGWRFADAPPRPSPDGLATNVLVVHAPGKSLLLDEGREEAWLSPRNAHTGFTTDW